MLLSKLFANTPDIEINQLSIDSRLPMKDCIFFCIAGIKDNGHDFIDEAIKNGANVVVYDEDIVINTKNAIFIKVSDTAECLNDIAAKFYGNPADHLDTYLSCGCNGTALVTYVLKKVLNNYVKTASIGEKGIFYEDHHLLSSFPTLTILDNQKYFKEFVTNNIKACVLETNAISLSYKKLDSITPKVFVYTYTDNESSEYTEISLNYFDVLCNYLYRLDDNTIVVLNKDDVSYDDLSKASPTNTYTYGFDESSDYVIKNYEFSKNKTNFTLENGKNKYNFSTCFLSKRCIYELVAALVTLNVSGYDLNEIAMLLQFIETLPGRMQPVLNDTYSVYVDDADTILTINNDLQFAKAINKDKGRIILLWGLNSRDKKEWINNFTNLIKDKVDFVIFTENNTYTETFYELIDDYKNLFKDLSYITIDDRYFAIEEAVDLLNSNDILLILGKGDSNFLIRNMGKESYKGDYHYALKEVNKRNLSEN